jgi:membrane fusion protein (multidrug efflux system)
MRKISPVVWKTLVVWIVGLALLTLLMAVLAGWFAEKIPADRGLMDRLPAAAVAAGASAVVEVKAVEEPLVERFPGSARPFRETVVSSRVIATVRDALVRTGASVKKGDPLIRLDDRDLQARVQQAERALQESEARLADAASAHDRAQTLRAQSVVSQSALDAAEANFKAATASAEGARQRLEEARVGLSFASIEAPFDGVVIDRFVDPGDTASPGVPLLKLYDPSRMRLEAYVRESLATRLSPGDKVRASFDALNAELEGVVEEISPEAEAGSRSFLIRVGLPVTDAPLYPGMFGRLLLNAGSRTRLLVPEAAVSRVGQLSFVLLADEAQTRRLVVEGGRVSADEVEILSGLKAGERVLAPSTESAAHL